MKTSESPARRLALKILGDVRKGAFAENALDRRLRSEPDLSRQDRTLTTELVYGVLRWKTRLDRILERCSDRPLKKIQPSIGEILRIALYQIFLLDRVPDHAAVNQAVIQARRSSGPPGGAFVNAVLRKAARSRQTVDPAPGDDAQSLADYYAHPLWLVERWIDEFSLASTQRVLHMNNSPALLVIRANTLKCTRDELRGLLEADGIETEFIDCAPDALTLSHIGRPVHSLPGYRDGMFVVQDPASQMIAPMLRVHPGDRVLDPCAAPGVKSAHLAALACNEIEVIAVDREPPRLEATRQNLSRLGTSCVECVRGDSSDPNFLRSLGLFDRILLDPPCTGLGVLRHNPETKYRITAKDPATFARTQMNMLKAAAAVLKPGGTLLYSVCTVSREETRDLIDEFLAEAPHFELDPITAPEVTIDAFLIAPGLFRSMPALTEMPVDGFFAARLRRVD